MDGMLPSLVTDPPVVPSGVLVHINPGTLFLWTEIPHLEICFK
jgi:hypothetical protein